MFPLLISIYKALCHECEREGRKNAINSVHHIPPATHKGSARTSLRPIYITQSNFTFWLLVVIVADILGNSVTKLWLGEKFGYEFISLLTNGHDEGPAWIDFQIFVPNVSWFIEYQTNKITESLVDFPFLE